MGGEAEATEVGEVGEVGDDGTVAREGEGESGATVFVVVVVEERAKGAAEASSLVSESSLVVVRLQQVSNMAISILATC